MDTTELRLVADEVVNLTAGWATDVPTPVFSGAESFTTIPDGGELAFVSRPPAAKDNAWNTTAHVYVTSIGDAIAAAEAKRTAKRAARSQAGAAATAIDAQDTLLSVQTDRDGQRQTVRPQSSPQSAVVSPCSSSAATAGAGTVETEGRASDEALSAVWQLTTVPSMHAYPRYSPCGRWLAYLGMDRPGYESDRMSLQMIHRETGEVRKNWNVWGLTSHKVKLGLGRACSCTHTPSSFSPYPHCTFRYMVSRSALTSSLSQSPTRWRSGSLVSVM